MATPYVPVNLGYIPTIPEPCFDVDQLDSIVLGDLELMDTLMPRPTLKDPENTKRCLEMDADELGRVKKKMRRGSKT